MNKIKTKLNYTNAIDVMKLTCEKKLVLTSIIVIIIATELVSAASAAVTSSIEDNAAAIRWINCTDPYLISITAKCAFLWVPLDYAKPNGTKIQLAISSIKHTVSNDKFQGIILVNPGGPGISGLSLVRLRQRLPASVSETYDWIGFDPRGIGSSKPALSCIPNYFAGPLPNYTPMDQVEEDIWLNRSKDYAIACAKNNPKLLEHMTTIDTVKDMESIRIALKQEQINYYGFSYGTYLGQVYATLFPNRVRRMVFDSNVDPREVWFKVSFDQNIGLDRNMRSWFRWLAKYDSVYHLGNTECAVGQRWDNVLNELKKNPANGIVGPGEWLDSFTNVPYSQSHWISCAKVFSQGANNKNFSSFVANYESTNGSSNDNGYAAYLAIWCTDTQWPQSWNYVRTANWRIFSKAPIFTWLNAWSKGPCQYWPVKVSKLVNVDGAKVGNILLIHETLDAPTPFKGSLEVRRRFPGARLIAVPGGITHGGSLRGNTCVDDLIINYLKSGEVPPRKTGDGYDVECAPLSEPVPFKPLPLLYKYIAFFFFFFALVFFILVIYCCHRLWNVLNQRPSQGREEQTFLP